ncbi:TAXI family TRAP transporter solute-binding subunit [Oceanobacter kriegii]|uniref:TAXI family TRAP transporter solute-binding subunit n=1 Tax=Oceanobacter kriegii TaxID=64972 RepID=UPI000408C3EE|nr:TAXI family TRAP transporter solute-binding subunit [Oceanobacter kriegii]
MLKKVLWTTIAFLGMQTAAANAGEAMNLNLCGGSPNGLWSLLGVGLDRAVKADNPESSVTYQTSSGGFANIMQIKKGACDLGIVHLGEASLAWDGKPPFRSAEQEFGVVGVLYNWAPTQWVMTRDFADKYGISSLEDLASKKPPVRIVMNRKGILPSIVAEDELKSLGVSVDDIEDWGGSVVNQGSSVASELIQNRRADMWVNQTFVGSSAIRSMSENMDMQLLEVPPAVVAAMAAKYGDTPFTIPSGAYPWLSKDITSNAATAMVVASSKMDPKVVEQLTNAMIEHIDLIQGVHSAMGKLTPQILNSQNKLAYLPGAVLAYKKHDLLVAAE